MNEQFALDPSIVRALPKGSKVVFVERHGKTNWAKGLKVEVEVDGEEKEYFLKITERERANEMALGEFESQKAMRQYIPNNVAKPLHFGPLEEDSSKAFYMCEFRDLRVKKPTASIVAAVLSKLHRDSVSPTGKFGFPVTTFKGYAPMNNEWCDRWEDWFARQFRMDIQFEQSTRGPDTEMDELFEEFAAKVIPRLLRPLQTNGRVLKPSLCHTDIWHGNIHFDAETPNPIIFDACCVYGHNEMELGMFRDSRYGWTPEYLQEYVTETRPSQPEEDFDDRTAIYAMRNYMVSAALWQHWAHMRQFVKDEMRRLLEKHPNGFEGFAEKDRKGEDERGPRGATQLEATSGRLCDRQLGNGQRNGKTCAYQDGGFTLAQVV